MTPSAPSAPTAPPSAPTPPTLKAPAPSAPPGPPDNKAPDFGKAPQGRPTIDPDDNPFSGLRNYGGKDDPKDAPKETPKDAPKKTPKDAPKDAPKDLPKDAPKDAPKDQPKDQPKDAPKDDKPAGRKTGWQMYHDEEKKTKQLTEEVAKLNRQLGEKAKTPADFKIEEHPEFKSTREKLSRYEKQVQELEEKIRFVDYESSSEYKEKFHKPYVDAWSHGKAGIEQMRVAVGEGEQPRNGTVQDLQRLVGAASLEEATQIAEELFGNTAKASYALTLRDRIIQKHQDAVNAREEFRTKGSEQMKLSAQEQERLATERAHTFNTAADEAVEKYPHWFKPEAGDEKGNELLDIGFMLANAAFGGQIKDGKTGEMRDPTPEEVPLLHAQLRNKAAGFDRLAYKNEKLQARITELEDMLSKYEETEPKDGEREGSKIKVDDDDDPFAKYKKK